MYQKAEAAIKAMEELRRATAERLLELGQRVPESIAKPWSRERLKHELAEREGDWWDSDTELDRDDPTHEQRFNVTRLQRLKDALDGERPCDATGYFSEEGVWITWEPTDEELKNFTWDDITDF